MAHWLHAADRPLVLLEWLEPVPAGHELLRLDEQAARSLLEWTAWGDALNMGALRAFLTSRASRPPHRMDDGAVLDAVSRLVASGSARIARDERQELHVGPAPRTPAQPARGPEPKRIKYYGRITGAGQALPHWPFRLKRNGTAVDQGSLRGRSTNAYRAGVWLSGAGGEFRFEDVEEGQYEVEVLFPAAGLTVNDEPPPAGVGEPGERTPTPRPGEGDADEQEEESWFRPPRVDATGDFLWHGDIETSG